MKCEWCDHRAVEHVLVEEAATRKVREDGMIREVVVAMERYANACEHHAVRLVRAKDPKRQSAERAAVTRRWRERQLNIYDDAA